MWCFFVERFYTYLHCIRQVLRPDPPTLRELSISDLIISEWIPQSVLSRAAPQAPGPRDLLGPRDP